MGRYLTHFNDLLHYLNTTVLKSMKGWRERSPITTYGHTSMDTRRSEEELWKISGSRTTNTTKLLLNAFVIFFSPSLV